MWNTESTQSCVTAEGQATAWVHGYCLHLGSQAGEFPEVLAFLLRRPLSETTVSGSSTWTGKVPEGRNELLASRAT